MTDIHAHEKQVTLKSATCYGIGKFAMQLGAGRATKSDSLLIMKQELKFERSYDVNKETLLPRSIVKKFYLKMVDFGLEKCYY